MAIMVKCPQCGLIVAAPDSAAGKKGRCTACGAITDIPLAVIAIVAEAPASAPVVERELATPPENASQIVLEDIPAADAAPGDRGAAFSNAGDAGNGRELESRLAPTKHIDLTLSPSSRNLPIQPKRKFSWFAIGLIVLGGLAFLGAVAGVVFYISMWPSLKDKFAAAQETEGLAALHSIEAAEKLHRQKLGVFAQRLSGPDSLESAGLAKLLADAEAPPGPAKPLAGAYYFKILTHQTGNSGERSYLSQGFLKNEYAILAYPTDDAFTKKAYLRGPDGTIYWKALDSPPSQPPLQTDSFDLDESWTLDSVQPPRPPGEKW